MGLSDTFYFNKLLRDQSVLLWYKTSQRGGASEAGSSGPPTLQNGDAVQGERSFLD